MRTATLTFATTGLIALACGSISPDVATLDKASGTIRIEPIAATSVPVSDEAKVMAFTQCMRDQGIQYKDPIVDSNGNVQRPVPVEDVKYTRAELAKPYSACSDHLEGITFGRERPNLVEAVDRAVKLSTCLRSKGFKIDDPTIETLGTWRVGIREKLDFNNPKVATAFRECRAPEEEESPRNLRR